MTTVRFAPSPTGRLHVGNVRAAVFNWLFARQTGGRFLLRLDDTDTERSTAAFATGIEEDLAWLRLTWDLFARQSDRIAEYQAAAERLKASGRLYPAYETQDELERRRRIQLASGRPPIYDRAALKLSDGERARLEAEGRRPHWRFRLAGRNVTWTDLVRGAQHIDTASLSDPVLIREDGTFLYALPSVVDDIAFAITHVIRGEDHVTNTGAQIEIFEALGAPPPVFAHYSLLLGADGAKLSKRLDSLSVASLREAEIEPLAVLALLAKLGTSDPVEAVSDQAPLIAGFDFAKIGRAPARFDEEDLAALSARILHLMPYESAAPRLKALGIDGGEAFWLAVRPNLSRLSQARHWWRILTEPLAPSAGDEDFRRAAAEGLPPEPFTEATWGEWTARLKEKTGRKGKDLFQPLRLALTGEPHGPDMKSLLPLIGRARALKRLGGEMA